VTLKSKFTPRKGDLLKNVVNYHVTFILALYNLT